jgi:hypothetical protein
MRNSDLESLKFGIKYNASIWGPLPRESFIESIWYASCFHFINELENLVVPKFIKTENGIDHTMFDEAIEELIYEAKIYKTKFPNKDRFYYGPVGSYTIGSNKLPFFEKGKEEYKSKGILRLQDWNEDFFWRNKNVGDEMCLSQALVEFTQISEDHEHYKSAMEYIKNNKVDLT